MSYRDTTTGTKFENDTIIVDNDSIELSKHALYRYLKEHNIDWQQLISRKILPDQAFFNEQTKNFKVYEKKTQENGGSADEKLQTCDFKLKQFKKIGAAIGATNVSYTYILNDWFKQPRYKDVLDYIRSIDGCDYIFREDFNAIK